jgi:uncharacterized membrane protein (DUF485 family)
MVNASDRLERRQGAVAPMPQPEGREHMASTVSSAAGGQARVEAGEARAQGAGSKTAHEVIASADFKALVSKRWKVSLVLLVLLFASYYGYILLIAGNPTLVNRKIGEVTTLAIPLGIAAIVIAWALTAFYVAWANKSYDPEVGRLKGQLKP